MTDQRPTILIDAAIRFGRPVIKGVSTEAIAGMVMAGEDVATVAYEYDLTRHEVLLACWHEGLQGAHTKQWGVWANKVHGPLGGWEALDVDALPDPPVPEGKPCAEVRYRSRRVWTFRKDDWYPSWYQKLGVPHLGGDEWGRRVVTVGFWFVGYLNWAWRTCWCQECHEMREQTYRLLADDDYSDRVDHADDREGLPA